MTAGPGPGAHDPANAPAPSEEELEEATERTAEVMDDARKQVDRARATLHDQLFSAEPSAAFDPADSGSEPGSDSGSESGSGSGDTEAGSSK